MPALRGADLLALPPIPVPEVLENPLPLVRRTRASLRRASPLHGAINTAVGEGLDVRIARGSLDRAMRICQALLNALAGMAYRIEREDKPDACLHVIVDEERIAFAVDEKIERKLRPATKTTARIAPFAPAFLFPEFDYVGTGVLTLRILGLENSGIRRSWSDGKHQRVEQRLPDFVATLRLAALHIKRERAERDRREQQWAAEERLRVEAYRRKEEEKRREEELSRLVSVWSQSARIRDFVQALRNEARAQGVELTPDTDLGRWVAWATSHAERLDPIPIVIQRANDESPGDGSSGCDADRDS